MTLAAGDHESVMSEGLGHSGGTLPDFTESQTRGHWAGAPVTVGQLTHYAVQIDISDLTSATDAAMGLYAGVFRWVTERPQYDGVTVVPTGENEGNVWKEGVLIGRNQLSPCDRIGDFNRGGDYASLSGINFAIDNTSDYGADPAGFDDYLLTNGYEIINRPVKIYCVIDDVFYQIWGGVISKTRYDLKLFEFICKDIFEQVHKPMPPDKIVSQKYPDADNDNIGKSIPIIFGDVLRSELFNISGKTDPLLLGYSDVSADELTITAATEYDIDGTGTPYLIIKTPNFIFQANDLINTGVNYLTVFKGTSQSVLIIKNDATTNPNTSAATTKIYLGKKLSVSTTDFNTDNAYSGTPIADTVWFFRIYTFSVVYLLSDKSINSFVQDDLNSLDLRRWNNDQLRYDPIPELIDDFDNTESNIYEAPIVQLLNNDIDIEGDFIRLIPIFPKGLKLIEVRTWDPPNISNLGFDSVDTFLDKDRSSGVNAGLGFRRIRVQYEVVFPDDFVIDNLDELYLCFDLSLEMNGNTGFFQWSYQVQDQFEQALYSEDSEIYPDTGISGALTINGLPNSYYKQGDDNSEDSNFQDEVSGTFLSSLLQIENVEDFKEALVSGRIILTLDAEARTPGGQVDNFTLNQIGFVGNQKINTIKDRLFVKTKGEEVGGFETNNLYRTIQHILESYDEIPSANIDYGNLANGSRDAWRTGRQVTERKLSSVYLKELSAQGVVGIYPDRRGKRHTKSFLDDVANIWTHSEDNGTIIKGSISRFEATPINEVYNDFKIEYDWNPGLNRFNKSIFVTNTDARTEVDPYSATFPGPNESTGTDQDFTVPGGLTSVTIDANGLTGSAVLVASPAWAAVGGKISFEDGSANNFYYATITSISGNTVYFHLKAQKEIAAGTYTAGTLSGHGSNVRKWTTWVGGINEYGTAKGYWEMCYNSWLKTQTVNKFPESLSRCYWYPDGAVYDGTAESDDNSAAHLYLAQLISWVTRQKNRTVYEIPVSKTNITIDQLDVIKFKDQKYTNGDYQTGYIEKVKINPRTDRIEIEAILRPDDMEVFPPDRDLIIELGNAPKTYTELGDAPKTITELGTP